MIVSCGEALIDFLPVVDAAGRPAFRPAPGGSPFNVAVALARLGRPTAFLGAISTDFFGDLLVDALVRAGVSTRYIARSNRPSTLAFVSLAKDEPAYAFFDEGSAGRLVRTCDLPAPGADIAALHFGSFSILAEPAGSEFRALLKANAGRRVTSFDPNIRPALIGEKRLVRATIDDLLPALDIVKVSAADLAWLLPGAAIGESATRWLETGPALVCVTRGAGGATAFAPGMTVQVPGRPAAVVDTVGAGDAFTGGLLARLDELGCLSPGAIRRMAPETLSDAVQFAVAASSLSCSREGADPPLRSEVDGHKK